MAVHPRTRGERKTAILRQMVDSGSSPHTRGTEGLRAWQERVWRFIPAHAGNGRPRSYARWLTPVHPRTRGERASYNSWNWLWPGSSPHTRGTALCNQLRPGEHRFIPAHAGNGAAGFVPPRALPVHPRTRGERAPTVRLTPSNDGSSPHTRGTGRGTGQDSDGWRFIPAHAGNGCLFGELPLGAAVHPRTRGERVFSIVARIDPIGSSPHTRGTAGSAQAACGAVRFIPAHAGNGCTPVMPRLTRTVHPRTRGERWPAALYTPESSGSSPHTRGTVTQALGVLDAYRFIPAHAGNGSGGRRLAVPGPVHPRTRGERSEISLLTAGWHGSSPHTRGTVLDPEPDRGVRRFIPAHAGNGRS